MRLLLISIFLVFAVATIAQSSSGYMGRKNTIDIGPIIDVFDAKLAWGASYHRVIGQRVDLGLQYFNSAGIKFKNVQGMNVGSGYYRVSPSGDVVAGALNAQYLGLHVRVYVHEYIAPVGSGVDIGVGRYNVRGAIGDKIRASYSADISDIKLAADYTYTYISVGAFKKSMIAGSKFYIETAANLSLFWNSELELSERNNLSSRNLVFAQSFFNDKLGRNFFKAKVSFGYAF